jgi:hypothetical protein
MTKLTVTFHNFVNMPEKARENCYAHHEDIEKKQNTGPFMFNLPDQATALPLIPIKLVAQWAPSQPVQTFWTREKSFAPTKIQSPSRSACSVVTTLITLAQVHLKEY